MDKVSEWLKSNWILVIAFFSISAAYGQATTKIQTMARGISDLLKLVYGLVHLLDDIVNIIFSEILNDRLLSLFKVSIV